MEATFLSEGQIWGEDALEVMKAYGTRTAPTDLAVLLGAVMTPTDSRTTEGDLTCLAWSASPTLDRLARVILSYCGRVSGNPTVRWVGSRPALPVSETSQITPDNIKVLNLPNGKRIEIVEWGEYPQTVTDTEISQRLAEALRTGHLSKTGKIYTFDSTDLWTYSEKFQKRECPEYMFEGKKYIRVQARADDDSVLSNGERVEDGKLYWVEVQPVEWLKDPSGIWVAKKALFAGVPFDTKEEYNGNFNETFIKQYLDTYFAKEVVNQYSLKEKEAMQEKIDSLSAEQLAELPQRDPTLLQKIVVLGQLAHVFERLPYRKQMPLYKSTKDKMKPDEKKVIENIIRAARMNQGK